jgi:squalene-associated FAD-dependent desaturase
MKPHVVIVGGGLSGLSAAVACSDAGARVTLLEARARLGGATWSTQRDGLTIDNGQHVFLRCCTAYRQFIRRLGVEDRVILQPRLHVPVIDAGGRVAHIRRNSLPAPLHLASSLLRFAHLSVRERVGAARTVQRLGRLDLDDPAVDECSFGAWLAQQGESARAIDGFWDLLVRPTLNLPARDGSLGLAAKVFQTGLVESVDGADIGYARVPLSSLHAEPARRFLEQAGAEVRLRTRVQRVQLRPDGGVCVWQDGARIDADAVIVATTHRAVADILPSAAGLEAATLQALGNSPIVNLHMVFDRRVMAMPMLAVLGMHLQWIFDRTDSAALPQGQYLTVSLSAADAYLDMSQEALRNLFLPEMQALFPAARGARLELFFATREPHATFRQGPGSRRLRPGCETAAPGVFVAGSWTDTGWPDTMESAVRSGMAAARAVLQRQSRLPEGRQRAA